MPALLLRERHRILWPAGASFQSYAAQRLQAKSRVGVYVRF